MKQDGMTDITAILIKFSLIALSILLLVFLIAVVVPYLAKFVDKIIDRIKNKAPKLSSYDFQEDNLNSVYDSKTKTTEKNTDNIDNIEESKNGQQ